MEKIEHEQIPTGRDLYNRIKKKASMCSLTDCIEMSKRLRCLPNQIEATNPVSMLNFVPIAELNIALADPTKNPLHYLKHRYPKGSQHRTLLAYLAELEPKPVEFCQQVLFEREASRLPDAFVEHFRQLKSCLECYAQRPDATVSELVQIKHRLGAPEIWADMLSELVLAPQVKPETVDFFITLFERVLPSFAGTHNLHANVTDLNTNLTQTSGPKKMEMAVSVGMSASLAAVIGDVNPTLKNFLSDALRYNYSEDEVENYQLLEALFSSTPDQDLNTCLGTYLYLTSRASAKGFVTALPQLALHNMISDLLNSISRTLLCCAIPATYMQCFSGADFKPVLDKLSAVDKTLREVSELLAVPRSTTFSACGHLFHFSDLNQCDELWTYKQCSSPWSSSHPTVGQLSTGPFGAVNSGTDLVTRLHFSDYSIYFEWSGLRPLIRTPSDALLASPILQRLTDQILGEHILSERLSASMQALSLEDVQLVPASEDRLEAGWDTGVLDL